eukprot:9040102-Pyramimonas_sp.AAC.1
MHQVKVSSRRAEPLRAESGPDGVLVQRSAAGSLSNAALDRGKDEEDFVSFSKGTDIKDALQLVSPLEGGRGPGRRQNGA